MFIIFQNSSINLIIRPNKKSFKNKYFKHVSNTLNKDHKTYPNQARGKCKFYGLRKGGGEEETAIQDCLGN